MAGRLETVVNVATLVACVAVVVTVYQLPRPPKPPERYQQGDKITGLDRAVFDKAEQTVVIALRDGCRYGDASMPFYRTMLQRQRSSAGARSTRFVALVLMESDAARAARYVQDKGLMFDDVLLPTPAQERQLKIIATPTIVITRPGGVVHRNWVGQLNKAGEEEVETEIFGSSAPTTPSQ